MPNNSLRQRLAALVEQPLARKLAAATPFWLVSAVSGAAIGASIAGALPGGEALAGVISGVATNLVSSTLYDAVKPDADDDSREAAIAEGLRRRDPAVLRLVAEALVHSGPDLAATLPAVTRADLVAALRGGMAEAGGPIAAIAPRYTDALLAPPADWVVLQAELRAQAARVMQTMDASEDGVISGSNQQVERADGPVEQTMRATKGGRIENSGQTVIGRKDTRRGG